MGSFPDAAWCTRIHQLLIAGDRTASAQLFRAIYPVLVGWLRTKQRTRLGELINDAATDALVEYIHTPTKWNPARATLISYLCMAADRDLVNAIRKHQRRSKREVLIPDVEVGAFEGNVSVEESDPSDAVQELLEVLEGHVTSRRDRELLQLMLTGERSTLKFASVLGIESLPASEQAAIVKRNKDRLKKVMQRLGRKQHG